MGMAERIKEKRLELGLTQEELGDKLGLQKSAIAKYENGRVENIKRSVIAEMAKLFNCSPAYLMGWDDNDKTEKDDETFVAKTDAEKRLLVMCRKVEDSSPEEKEELVNLFESTFDIYLKAKGLKK